MEDLLLNLAEESSRQRFFAAHEAAIEANALIECQQGTTRDHPHLLREKCFVAFKAAVETKRNKLIALAINGIYKMIRDDRFHSHFEPEDDSLWFPSQLLHTFSSVQTQSDDTQVDMLKVLLYVACSTYCTVNGRIIIQILSLCSELHENGTEATKSASQAACSQILCSFCHFLDEECEEINSDGTSNSSGVLCFNEVIPILQFICCKFDEGKSVERVNQPVVFFLECLHSLLSSLPHKIHTNRHFTAFLWQKLCPALIAFLGSPRVDKKIVCREERNAGESGEVGRGSGGLASALSFDSYQAKTIYSIGNQLVRLVGCVGSLRPVLEAVYHRMLLYPSPEHRLEALKALKEVFRSTNRVVDFAGPILIEDDRQQCYQQSDIALVRLVMDAIEESSQCGKLDIVFACVSCISSLIFSLTDLSNGKGLNEKYVEKINATFPQLEACDYTGPLTYDTVTRLPLMYQEIIQNSEIIEIVSCSSRSSGLSSGDTDGPEEGYEFNDFEVEEVPEEMERRKMEEESARLSKIKEASSGHEINIDVKQQKFERLDSERENARQFVKALLSLLPNLFQLRSTLQVDEALQELSSKYCQSVAEGKSIVNADGIYLATCAALRLNLKLISVHYYEDEDVSVPVTEDEFVKEVQGSGILVYLSASWLSELYQQVLSTNLLQLTGYEANDNEYVPLINLLSDIGGNICGGNSILSDYQRLEKALQRQELTQEMKAGRKLSRRILSCCWDSIMAILSTSLQLLPNGNPKSRIQMLVRNRNADKMFQDCYSTSLETLQNLAQLTTVIEMQHRCGSIFALLVNAACSDNNYPRDSKKSSRDVPCSLKASQVLSMDVTLRKALELGCYAPDSWKYVFRCAAYVCRLEQALFRKNPNSVNNLNNKKSGKKSKDQDVTEEMLKLTLDPPFSEDDEVMDVFSFLASPPSTIVAQEEQSVMELIRQSKAITSSGKLRDDCMQKVVCLLSGQVDKLFEEAALKLNLESLEYFVKDLCSISHNQLFSCAHESDEFGIRWWNMKINYPSSIASCDHSLFLLPVNRVMLKCIVSGRPLIHTMKIWSIIGPHYIQAACSKEHNISKIAVNCIYDTITCVLNQQTELPYFHFNEALFKPLEILLCLELCDSDIQDQIVSCICELVEGNRMDIKSGWRTLFGGLKVLDSSHTKTLYEVFRVFLINDNMFVFSYAAVDFINCLLRHVKGNNEDTEKYKGPKSGLELSSMALQFVHECSRIFGVIYGMATCPTFHSINSSRIYATRVDPTIPDKELILFTDDSSCEEDIIAYDVLTIDDAKGSTSGLLTMDRNSGILRVWYTLIEGLSYALVSAEDKYQSQIMDVLFVIIKDLIKTPGVDFGLLCINDVVLQSIQQWLRKSLNGQEFSMQNMKQCYGLMTDLVVHYLLHLNDIKEIGKGTLMIKQLILLLVEMIASYKESVTGLGCACFKHVVLSTGHILSEDQWEILSVGLYRACTLSLLPLSQLMAAFYPCSESFYGDVAQVKVAARRDSTPEEISRIRQLSQQIFLLKNQCEEFKEFDIRLDDERSYVLLLCPLGDEKDESQNVIVRVPFRDIVIGLLANQLILQIIATLLIQGTPHVVPSLAKVLIQDSILPTDACKNGSKNIYGLTSYMNRKQIKNLLNCLDISYEKALAFDSRPGLKFLMQKVAGLEKAANLYRQAGACWTLRMVALCELYLYESRNFNVTVEKAKEIMERIIETNNIDEDKPYVSYLKQLRESFDKICDRYVDIIMDKDGVYSVIDSVSDQPIFFLIPQADNFLEPLKNYENMIEKKNEDGNDKNEEGESIYMMATSKNIDNVVEEYAKRKKQCSAFPSKRTNVFSCSEVTKGQELLPPEIEQQRKTSISKDSEAQLAVWAEVLISVFDVLAQLTDEEFRILVPVFFNGVRSLTAHANHASLKHTLAEFFHRVALLYGFSP